MKTVLTIQSQVANARVGNSVAAFALERLGVRALCLPTTLLGRRPDRAAEAHVSPGGGPIPPSWLAEMLDALEDDGALANVDVGLSGYLADAGQAKMPPIRRRSMSAIPCSAIPKAACTCARPLRQRSKARWSPRRI
jgi:pyridoxal/pyridoxine/pyridoxamine kinase